MPLPLLVLALSAFAIGTTEFVIMGLLPEVAAEFGAGLVCSHTGGAVPRTAYRRGQRLLGRPPFAGGKAR
mgnify:CR=1 FL=1